MLVSCVQGKERHEAEKARQENADNTRSQRRRSSLLQVSHRLGLEGLGAGLQAGGVEPPLRTYLFFPFFFKSSGGGVKIQIIPSFWTLRRSCLMLNGVFTAPAARNSPSCWGKV